MQMMEESKGQQLHASSSEAITNNVRVEVESQYAAEHSRPFQDHWFFHYTVRITNEGDGTVQLLSRHWVITDANGKVEEVRGDGVIGEQPYLKPGQGFRYSSGAVLETPVGTMQGSYQMLADDGAHFDAPIQPFRLAMPGILQ
jgi:ApaG protein